MERLERSRKKKQSDTRGGFAGVDRGSLATRAPSGLTVFGVSATLFKNSELATYLQQDTHLVPHPSASEVTMDRFDVRLLLDNVEKVEFSGGGGLGMEEMEFGEELEKERFGDLVDGGIPEEEEDEDVDEQRRGGAAVPYQYQNEDLGSQAPRSSKIGETEALPEPMFVPSFPVPDHLVDALPSSEKCHKLILQTAKFVRKAGGQVEVVLRVKQGNNPNFSFLLPDDRLFPYYRWMVEDGLPVDTQKDEGDQAKTEKQDTVQESEAADNSTPLVPVNSTGMPGTTPNALDVLRSYNSCGSLDGTPSSPVVSPSSQKVSALPEEIGTLTHKMDQGTSDLSTTNSLQEEGQQPPEKGYDVREETVIPVIHQLGGICSTTSQSEAITEVNGSPEPGVPGVDDLSEADPNEAELGAETRAIMEKLVTFIQRNGAKFERVVRKRENMNPKFGFMLPWHPHHSAYRKRLTEVVGEKTAAEIFSFWGMGEQGVTHKSNNLLSDVPQDATRKEEMEEETCDERNRANLSHGTIDRSNIIGLENAARSSQICVENVARDSTYQEDDQVCQSPTETEGDGHHVSLIKANPSFGRNLAQKASPEPPCDSPKQKGSNEAGSTGLQALADTGHGGADCAAKASEDTDSLSKSKSTVAAQEFELPKREGKQMTAEEKKAQRRLKARMLLEKDKAKKMEFEVAHRTQKARAVLDHRQAFLADEDDFVTQTSEDRKTVNDGRAPGASAADGAPSVSELPALTEVFSAAAEHAKKHQEAFVATLRDPNQVLTKLGRLHSQPGDTSDPDDLQDTTAHSHNRTRQRGKSPKRSKKQRRSRDRRSSGSSKRSKRSPRRERHKKHHKKEKSHRKRKQSSLSGSDDSGSTSAPDRGEGIAPSSLKKKIKQMLDDV